MLPAEFVIVSTTTAPGPVNGSVEVNSEPFDLVCVSIPGIVVVSTKPLVVSVVTFACPGTSPWPIALSELTAISRLEMMGWYWVGMALRKAGGVAAMRAEVTMELMSPVMLADEAAAWTATPRPGRRDCGMYWGINWRAATENWEGERGVGRGVVVVLLLEVAVVEA